MEQGGWQVVLDKDAGSLMWEVGLSLSRQLLGLGNTTASISAMRLVGIVDEMLPKFCNI